MPPTAKKPLLRRAKRYANVGTKVGGMARAWPARVSSACRSTAPACHRARRRARRLKGPIMKVAQLLATFRRAAPEYANELIKLQSQAPPMGWAFVKRRMSAELGLGLGKEIQSFDHHPAAAASLGQCHRARASTAPNWPANCNIQTCSRRSKPDLRQLKLLFAIRRRFDPAIETSEIAVEIAARLREELDYIREARHIELYRLMLKTATPSACPKSGLNFPPAGC